MPRIEDRVQEVEAGWAAFITSTPQPVEGQITVDGSGAELVTIRRSEYDRMKTEISGGDLVLRAAAQRIRDLKFHRACLWVVTAAALVRALRWL